MSSPNLHPMLNVAVKAARAAGAIINRAALDVEAVRVSQKQVNDFVTEVDQWDPLESTCRHASLSIL